MKRFIKISGFLLALTTSAAALAEQTIQVWGRGYHHSCRYYSSTEADFDVTLYDTAIPYGASVTLVSGLGVNPQGSSAIAAHWQSRIEQPMEAIDTSTWRVRRNAQINERGSPSAFSRIEFVFRVDRPGENSYWILPASNGSYYFGALNYEAIPCLSTPDALPEFTRLPVQAKK